MNQRIRLAPLDVLRLGLLGLRTRRTRAALSALGIAIGIATLVVVTGIPASSQRALMNELSALGTNMLRAQPPPSGSGPQALLPEAADAMAARIGPVTSASAVANTHATVRRSDLADPNDSIGMTVLAARTNLLGTIGGSMGSGRFLSPATEHFPTAVLGHRAASRLGFDRIVPGSEPLVSVDGHAFTVIGVLRSMPLTPELDTAVLVGWDAARDTLGFDGHPTVIYVKAVESRIEAVRDVLPATVNPELPGLVQVSRPSDALAAKRATQHTFSALFLGLAGVALLVGGIGVANTMVVSVLERRREIGLRRALGANRRQIRGQFLAESVALSVLGGLTGTVLGAAATAGYALSRSWPPVLPPLALAAGVLGAVVVGAAAGVYPAVRASRLPPTEALAAV
ncbi:ABC transporter permease [Streptomyces sp. NPDC046977]|uniref:ABC transporter permease n=1 Tax=Streptomyces sp. NPDC046977 TaxID=3154703 RepID=UPI0033F48E00